MVTHARLRTVHVHLARQELMVAERRDRSFTRQDLADFEPSFEVPNTAIAPDASILDNGEGLMHAARAVFDHQGFHTPMAMIFETRDLPPTILDLHTSDTQEQVLMIDAVVEAVERTRAEGIVFISEMRNPESGEGELVVAALADDGAGRVWRTRLERSDGGTARTGRTVSDNDVTPTFLLPVERAWTAMGRGRSRTKPERSN